jgi:hypothetical protein
MALDKAGLKTAIQHVFEKIGDDNQLSAADAATQLSDAIDSYVKTALATVSIPPGTVVIAAASIAVPVLNPAPISLTGGPSTTPPGGLS